MRLLYFFTLLYLFLLSGITGCDANSSVDVREFIDKTKKAPKAKVEPLPEHIEKVDSSYSGGDKRSPFVTHEEFIKGKTAKIDSIKQPDMKRPKEILEKYNLNELTMVGSIKKSDGNYSALVADSTGKIYQVIQGNYIGNNYGKVRKIGERGLEIEEALSDNAGGWRANTVIMNLKE